MTLRPHSSPPSDLSVAYPSLIELTYHADEVMLMQESIIAPRLESFILHNVKVGGEQRTFPWLNKDGTPSTLGAKRLSLVNCKITKQLVKSLRPNDKVEQLEMTGCQFFIDAVRTISIICPSLSELWIIPCYFTRKVAAEVYDTVFLDIIKTRKQKGIPLKKLIVGLPLWMTQQNDSRLKDYAQEST